MPAHARVGSFTRRSNDLFLHSSRYIETTGERHAGARAPVPFGIANDFNLSTSTRASLMTGVRSHGKIERREQLTSRVLLSPIFIERRAIEHTGTGIYRWKYMKPTNATRTIPTVFNR